MTHLLLFSSLGSRQIAAAAGQHKPPIVISGAAGEGATGRVFFGGGRKKKGIKSSATRAPRVWDTLGIGVAKIKNPRVGIFQRSLLGQGRRRS